MAIKEKIQKELKESLKEKNQLRSSVLRMLLSALLNKEIELKKKEVGLNKEEELQVVKSEMKKHRKSIEAYEKASRSDLVDKEKKELEILKSYDDGEQQDVAKD